MFKAFSNIPQHDTNILTVNIPNIDYRGRILTFQYQDSSDTRRMRQQYRCHLNIFSGSCMKTLDT